MLNLTAKIKIGGGLFNRVGSVKITTSVDDFMDTATLVLPRGYAELVKEGAEVEIILGYVDKAENYEFFGHVAEVCPSPPYEIRCYCPFNYLRKFKVERWFRPQPAYKIVEHLLKGTGYSPHRGILEEIAKKKDKLYAIAWDGYKNVSVTVRKAIAKLAMENGYFAYFVGRKLHFRDRLTAAGLSRMPLFTEGLDIIDHSLLYHQGNTVRKVTVISDTAKQGRPTKGVFIDRKVKDSTLEKEFVVSGLDDDNSCASRAKEISEQLNAPGYTGDFKTFGAPFVRAGQLCAIKMRGEKSATIQAVRKTEVTFDGGGYRRIITPLATTKDVYSASALLFTESLDYFKRRA
ncbi:MAG: hypothetical protein J0L53_07145 [Spirochaetes bacterium]|nr:hypothetical protein [Spirochaetota bacterium]